MAEFSCIPAGELSENPFSMIGKRWMLVCAGTKKKYNMMTASWGGLGVLWGNETAMIFVRPGRYTNEFLESNEGFSLSFFPESSRDVLDYCGKISGREVNKAEHCALTPVFGEAAPYFAEADTVLVCKKLYYADIDPANFCDPTLGRWYDGDYHRMYVGKIEKVLRSF